MVAGPFHTINLGETGSKYGANLSCSWPLEITSGNPSRQMPEKPNQSAYVQLATVNRDPEMRDQFGQQLHAWSIDLRRKCALRIERSLLSSLFPAFSRVCPSALIAKIAKMAAHRELDRACFLPARFKDHARPSALPAGRIGLQSPKRAFLPIEASCWLKLTAIISAMMDRSMC